MPRFKNVSGCYNKHDAREFGLAAAVVWNDIIDRAEHFDAEKIWYDQSMASERLGIPQQTISRSLKTLEEVGRIKVDGGYRPNSSIRTTWISVSEDYLDDNLITQNGYSKVTQNGYSILNDTKEPYLLLETQQEGGVEEKEEDVATILSLTQLLATISQLVRTHNRRNKEKLFFDKKKMEANYDRLKEKLEDAGLDFGKKEVEQVFKRALDSINEADSKANYLAGTNQVDVFFHPNNIQHFLLSGEVKEYDEVTARAYNWIINNGYAKDVADIKAREDEIYKQVIDNEEYQRVLRGM